MVTKKAMLFSTVTVLFFVLFLSLSTSFSSYFSFTNEQITRNALIKRDSVFREEVGMNILSIYDIILHKSTTNFLHMSGVSVGKSYSLLLLEYQLFLETTYKELFPVFDDIVLEQRINTSNGFFEITDTSFLLTEEIEALVLELHVDSTVLSYNISSTGTGIPLQLKILDNTGLVVDDSLDVLEGSGIFQTIDGIFEVLFTDTIVSINTTGVLVDINTLEVNLSSRSKQYLSTGFVNQKTYEGAIPISFVALE